MDCLFCKIIKGEIPCYKIYEDDMVLAFLDVNPKENGHTLIIPKKHYTDYLELDINIFEYILKIAKNLSQELMENLKANGITFAWNYGNVQAVKHFHLHLIPRYDNKSSLKDIKDIYAILKK